MRHLTRIVLLAWIAFLIGCSPASEPGPQSQAKKPSASNKEEATKDPFSDVQKDEVNDENLDKPLIKDPD